MGFIQEHNKTFDKRVGTTSNGTFYENYMVAKLALQLTKDNGIQTFKLSSNDSNFGAFDDIILVVEPHNKTRELYALQLKYSNTAKVLTISSLTGKSGNFSIPNFFKSFQEKKLCFSGFKLILMTNRKFNTPNGTQIQIEDGETFQVLILRTQSIPLLNNSKKTSDCFKFQIVKNTTTPVSSKLKQYEDFFESFYLYANQINVEKIKTEIRSQFQKEFGHDVSVLDKYMKFINEWSSRDGQKEKLDKEIIQKCIALHLLSPYILPFSSHLVTPNAKILQRASDVFTVTVFEKTLAPKVLRVWGDIKDKLKNIDIKEINRVRRLYEPDSNYVNDVDMLGDEESTRLLWLCDDQYPLIVSENGFTYEAIKLCGNKKYILLRDDPSIQMLPNYNVFWKLSHLDNQSIVFRVLTRSFMCNAFGSDITLENLLDEYNDFQEMITTTELIDMIDGPYVINQQVQEELPTPHITRFLSPNLIDFKYLEVIEEDTFILVSNVQDEETKLRKYLPRKLFSIKKGECSREEFEKIVEDNAEVKKYLHFITREGHLHLIQSIGRAAYLENYHIKGSFMKEAELYTPNYHNYVNIITADPGMGKSVFLQSLKNNLSSHLCTVILSPEDISNICKSTQDRSQQDQIEDFILKLKFADCNEFRSSFIKALMQKGQIVYLWDAMDEISDKYLEFITDLVEDFSKKVSIQWLAARRHLKKLLQDKFNVFPISIAPFDNNDQSHYIKRRLQFDDSKTNEDVIKTIKDNIAVVNTDIVAIPQQIFMLTELFLRNKEKYFVLISSKLFSLADLYHYFVEEKYNFFYCDKVGIDFSKNEYFYRTQQPEKMKRTRNYQKAALRVLLDADTLTKWNIYCNEFIEEIEQQTDHFGFITEVTVGDKKPLFVHNSYAEYFAASYFAENYNRTDFGNVIFDRRYTNVRFFFDNLLAKDSFPHLAVLYKNLESLKKYESRLQDCKDLGGRNLLHLAASWGEKYDLFDVQKLHNGIYEISYMKSYSVIKEFPKSDREILEYLLEKCEVHEVDEVFKLNPLGYADKCGCLLNVIIIESNKNTGYLDLKNDQFICSILFYSVYFGYDRFINLYKNIATSAITWCGQTLLHLSSERGHQEITHLLIRYGIDINTTDPDGYTPLHLALLNGNYATAKLLILSGASVNFCKKDDYSPLHLASKRGFFKTITLLIESQANVNDISKSGDTALHLASSSGHSRIARLLIRSNTDVNAVNADGYTPLHLASFYGHIKVVKLLIKFKAVINIPKKTSELYGANVENTDTDGDIPLHLASRQGHYKIAEILLKFGAEINAVNKKNQTPLHLALKYGNREISKILIEYKANTTDEYIEDIDGNTPLHLASRHGHYKIAKILIQSRAKVNAVNIKKWTPLHFAIQNGHCEIAKLLIESDANITVTNIHGHTPLHLASLKGHYVIAKLLIERHVSINVCNEDGYTALHLATRQGHYDVAELLINSRANVNATTHDGYTPLHLAARNGCLKIAEFLIRCNADMNVANKNDNTPLHLALWMRHQSVAELLINSKANINTENTDGNTPLHLALIYSCFEIAEMLIKFKANLEVANSNGDTPLQLSSECGNLEIAKMLLLSGANVNVVNPILKTSPIHTASLGGRYKIVELLINHDADINILETNGYTPLLVALEKEHYNVAKLLIESRAKVNIAEEQGYTPLHFAVLKGWQGMVELLIKYDADINVTNNNGDTPLHLALKYGQCIIAESLNKSGASLQ